MRALVEGGQYVEYIQNKKMRDGSRNLWRHRVWMIESRDNMGAGVA